MESCRILRDNCAATTKRRDIIVKKLSIILAFILLSASVAFALGETETGNISTDVEKANVTTSSGFMGGKQDVNVGGVDVEGRTTDKMKTGNISTTVKDVNVTTSSGFKGGDQDVNVGGVKIH
jgi:hypothetical protein